jgi:hypothetical protein
MTTTEHDRILDEIALLFEYDKDEEAFELAKKLPLPAVLAMSAKETMGVDKLLAAGFNLSEAEAVYGKDWLGI